MSSGKQDPAAKPLRDFPKKFGNIYCKTQILMTPAKNELRDVARLKFQKCSALKFSSRAIPGTNRGG